MFVLSLSLSWFAVQAERARRHQEVIANIQRLGGRVSYRWQGLASWQPSQKWLRTLLGKELPHQISCVSLQDTQVSDADIACLDGFCNLEALWLDGTQVTDDALQELQQFRRLRTLVLGRTSITDAGLAHIGKIHTLTYLSLDETRIGDDGLEHLKGLSQLRSLIVGPGVTKEGVGELRQALPHCIVWDSRGPIAISDEERLRLPVVVEFSITEAGGSVDQNE